MTLGEKIKAARKQCGLSQEQLAEKMAVSRSAIAKWEGDNGIPDVANLKTLAKLLNVSVDYLLDDGEKLDEAIIREAYNISEYGKGTKKRIKDSVVRSKYQNAVIHPLIGEVKLTKTERIVDNLIGFLTDAPFGIPQIINYFKNTDKQFYLVEQNEKHIFVTVTDEFVESHRLARRMDADKFEIGNMKFTKCKHLVK